MSSPVTAMAGTLAPDRSAVTDAEVADPHAAVINAGW
jgi:hypothetical protein